MGEAKRKKRRVAKEQLVKEDQFGIWIVCSGFIARPVYPSGMRAGTRVTVRLFGADTMRINVYSMERKSAGVRSEVWLVVDTTVSEHQSRSEVWNWLKWQESLKLADGLWFGCTSAQPNRRGARQQRQLSVNTAKNGGVYKWRNSKMMSRFLLGLSAQEKMRTNTQSSDCRRSL